MKYIEEEFAYVSTSKGIDTDGRIKLLIKLKLDEVENYATDVR